jgi:hypothetical protein
MSRKHTGFRFAVQTVLLLLVALLFSNTVLANTPFLVIVEYSKSDPLSGLKIRVYHANGNDVDMVIVEREALIE